MYKQYYFHVIVAPTILCDHTEDTVIIKVEGISQDKAEQKLMFKRYVLFNINSIHYVHINES